MATFIVKNLIPEKNNTIPMSSLPKNARVGDVICIVSNDDNFNNSSSTMDVYILDYIIDYNGVDSFVISNHLKMSSSEIKTACGYKAGYNIPVHKETVQLREMISTTDGAFNKRLEEGSDGDDYAYYDAEEMSTQEKDEEDEEDYIDSSSNDEEEYYSSSSSSDSTSDTDYKEEEEESTSSSENQELTSLSSSVVRSENDTSDSTIFEGASVSSSPQPPYYNNQSQTDDIIVINNNLKSPYDNVFELINYVVSAAIFIGISNVISSLNMIMRGLENGRYNSNCYNNTFDTDGFW
jgi:hypothetical protein